MHEVAIVGAGELGGLIAHALARRDAADVVRLIDDSGRVAEGKALDISQAAPLEGFAATVTGSADLSAATAADIVVIADRVGGSERAQNGPHVRQPRVGPEHGSRAADVEWQSEDGLTLVRRMRGLAPRALLLCAGLQHRELIDRSARELRIPRSRIVGSASEAFVAAARAIVALELDISPRDIALSILGIPPGKIVIAWEDAAIAGFSLREMISEPVRRGLSQRIAALWPVGPYALASAACKVVESAAGNSRRPVTCFVAPDDGAAVRTRTAALPVRLGPEGIVEVILPVLSAAERVALDNAIML